MDTTTLYSEAKGAIPFDWNAFLADSRTGKEWDEATELAGKWVTCACGNQCAALPRYDSGTPKDDTLARYGIGFYDAIEDRDRDTATAWLNKIERRSALLLAQQIQLNSL